MSTYRPTVLTVSLSRLGENFRAVKRFTKGRPSVMAVVKADAYGHGMAEVARRMLKEGADALAVATVDESVELREAGIRAPILILGGSPEDGLRAAVDSSVAQAVFDEHSLRILEDQAKKRDVTARAHLKIDTGMSRVGVRTVKELNALLEAWKDCPHVRMEGMFTHYCAADQDVEYTRLQDARFMAMAAQVKKAGYSPLLHSAASSGLALGPEFWHDMVRPGIALYGAAVRDQIPGIAPAQRLTTRPVRVETIPVGEKVSYGCTFTAQRESVIMTVPIGYGDGYLRSLSNKGEALVRGRRAPVAGRVCMDQLMLDVTDIPGASMGDEVVLLGSQGDDCITPDELAAKADTIPWEIMLGFHKRVTRRIEE